MADIVHPEAQYRVQTVGKATPVNMKDGGKLLSYDIQLEGIPDWVSILQAETTPAPKKDDTLEGHVEDGGKYGLKFKKKRTGGFGGGGGGQASPGAIWSAAFATAAHIMAGYVATLPEDKRPKRIDEYFERVEQIAVNVKAAVERRAGETPAAPPTPPPAPAAPAAAKPADNTNVEIEDLGQQDLGEW
jgi:hypothetical protein